MDEFKKKILNEIAKSDKQPIGNIILNLTGCKFCQAFDIDGKCEGKKSCTDFIDNFVKSQYIK
jgi:hypothetical protein